MGPSTAALALGQWQRGGQQGGSGPYSRFHLSAPNLLRGSDFQEGRSSNPAAVTTEAQNTSGSFLLGIHQPQTSMEHLLQPGPRLDAEHWRRDCSGPVLQGSSSSRQSDALPRRSQRELTAAREAQGEGRLRRLTAPPTPRGCPYRHRLMSAPLSAPHTKPLLPLLSGLQLLLCPLATSASPDPGQRDCGRNQVLAERLWERIVWVGQVAITFQPLGSWSLRSTGTNHLPHSLCAPGPGRPQAQCLAMPLLF